jgi:hypothetical protein
VEFSSLDYSAPERNRYAHRLQGFDSDWIATESTRRLARRALQGGRCGLVRGQACRPPQPCRRGT